MTRIFVIVSFTLNSAIFAKALGRPISFKDWEIKPEKLFAKSSPELIFFVFMPNFSRRFKKESVLAEETISARTQKQKLKD